ncbi:MAG TPA: hypothetical protein VMW20_08065 [Candidatus Nanoarchaeia archaeon]|nr:hypothetical protein [Candidatus Nanoarchaeia archaeon]
MKCDCTQGRELIQTGRSEPDADLICPVCGLKWWSYQGEVIKECPAEGSTKKEEKTQTWELKGGGWFTAKLIVDPEVTNGCIGQVKHREIYLQPNEMYRVDYVKRVLRLWGCSKELSLEKTTQNII